MTIARRACSRAHFSGPGGAEQRPTGGDGRGAESAQGQGGVDLDPGAVILE
jgi:hypothetical protein